MSFILLVVCCSLIAFGLVNGLLTALVALLWRFVRRWDSAIPSSWLFLLRVIPASLSTAFAALAFVPSFLIHEPRESSEAVSLSLCLAAGGALSLVVAGGGRGVIAWRRTNRLIREWRRSASPVMLRGWRGPAFRIDVSFPVVSVAGAFNQTLFLARSVEESCTAEELEAVTLHEAAHAAGRDNLKTLVVRSLPDWLSFTPTAAAIENAWKEASEREADLAASRGTGAVELASALVKVSRLACARPQVVASSALYRGGPITRRIRGLIEDPSREPRSGGPWWWLAWVAFVASMAGLVLFPSLSSRLHQATELIVQVLS